MRPVAGDLKSNVAAISTFEFAGYFVFVAAGAAFVPLAGGGVPGATGVPSGTAVPPAAGAGVSTALITARAACLNFRKIFASSSPNSTTPRSNRLPSCSMGFRISIFTIPPINQ
jgi:hypothetical protein